MDESNVQRVDAPVTVRDTMKLSIVYTSKLEVFVSRCLLTPGDANMPVESPLRYI